MPTTEMVGFRIPVRKTEPKAKSSAAVLVNVGICHTGLFPYLRPYFLCTALVHTVLVR
jgi:hypothetical protein